MDGNILLLNGLSPEILDSLSFKSKLGINLKKNLHYFDKNALIAELTEMTDWLDERNRMYYQKKLRAWKNTK